jgi:hypothetical protein
VNDVAKTFSVEQDMTGRLHIVTGMPGTGVADALQGLSQYAAEVRQGSVVKVVSVDRILGQLAKPSLQTLGLSPAGRLSPFLLPQQHLRSLWEAAVRNAVNEANEHLAQDSDVILTLHLCYYHHKYRQFVVIANFELLRRLVGGRAQRVITLVDDVYDVQVELSRSGQVFTRPRVAEDPYVSGLRVLAWRANEILVSASVAAALDTTHFVFAVKHPIATLYDLLYSSKRTAYLSHPISEVRRLMAGSQAGEGHALLQSIQDLTRELSQSHVVFEPTAIDEYRFKKAADGAPDCSGFCGNLSPRWPFAPEARRLSWTEPRAEPSSFNFPFGWQSDERPQITCTPVINEFVQTIARQIGARDHWLVEQSDIIVCFRPIFEGHSSSGVMHELMHVDRLRRLQERGPSRVIAIVPENDRKQFPARDFEENFLSEEYKKGSIVGDATNLKTLQARIRAAPDSPLMQRVLSGEADALQELLRQFDMDVMPAHGVDGEGVLDDDEQARRQARAEELAAQVGDSEPYFDVLPMVECYTSIESALAVLRA